MRTPLGPRWRWSSPWRRRVCTCRRASLHEPPFRETRRPSTRAAALPVVVRQLPRPENAKAAGTGSHDRSMDPRRQRRAAVSAPLAVRASGNRHARCPDRGRDTGSGLGPSWPTCPHAGRPRGGQARQRAEWRHALLGQGHLPPVPHGPRPRDSTSRRIGVTRSRHLIAEIRTPSPIVHRRYWPVTVVARDTAAYARTKNRSHCR